MFRGTQGIHHQETRYLAYQGNLPCQLRSSPSRLELCSVELHQQKGFGLVIWLLQLHRTVDYAGPSLFQEQNSLRGI